MAALLTRKTEIEPAHIADCMADAIAVRMRESGECRITQLRDMGFSLDDIARHWPQAW